jgi:hypothetical protein
MTKSTNKLAILLLLAPILAACSENIDNRGDRRDDRQDCRQEEGVVGGDKRDCKQDERAADAVS